MTGIEAACFGTLTKDADHRTSKNGKPYTLLNVAVGEGETRQFVSAIVFGDAAVEVANLEKDRRVYVEGKIEINEWVGQDGTKRSGLKISSSTPKRCAIFSIGMVRAFSTHSFHSLLRGIAIVSADLFIWRRKVASVISAVRNLMRSVWTTIIPPAECVGFYAESTISCWG